MNEVLGSSTCLDIWLRSYYTHLGWRLWETSWAKLFKLWTEGWGSCLLGGVEKHVMGGGGEHDMGPSTAGGEGGSSSLIKLSVLQKSPKLLTVPAGPSFS